MNLKFLALDIESFLISNERPWESPKPVSLAICSHDESILRLAGNFGTDFEELLEFSFKLMFEEGYHWVWQNGITFDLPLIWNWFPQFRPQILAALDKGLIHDTMVRERLFDLSTTGEIKMKKGAYSLEFLVKKYLGEDISSFKSGGDIWRLRHCELDGMKAADYPEDAIEYDLKDVIWLKDVFLEQERNRAPSGFGSMNTESLQVKSAFVLHLTYQKGIPVNLDRLLEFEASLDERMAPLQKFLIDRGMAHLNKKGKFTKRDKEFRLYLSRYYPQHLKYTAPTKKHPDGQISIEDSALADFPDDSVIRTRQSLSVLEKYKNTYIKNIKRHGNRFFEKYDFLKETGRTSSFMQTMPREGGIRELFEAESDCSFVILDYAHIEADVMAQVYHNLGLGSGLIDYINTGADYHALIGSAWYNDVHSAKLTPEEFSQRRKSGDEEAKRFRTLGKPAGLGLSGGIGPDTLQTTASGQGVDLTKEQAIASLRFAENSIPGLVGFRGRWGTKEKGWLGEQQPVDKQKIGTRTTKDGRKVPVFRDLYAYSANGRFRNNCTYCALANGISMQSLAADGAKEAIWLCFKYLKEKEIAEGCEVGNLALFVHDEIGFQIYKKYADSILNELAELMCAGMQAVLPDLRITTEGYVSDLWTKDESQYILKSKAWRTPDGRFEYITEATRV